ncbi:hypothetical protein [Jannaschia sp. LMIT008]|uniref:hypothetical protein n=1 Tax=Jannaschia maritima TaxID=3032585 RepID=UPI0028116418|nr:hypothetical protein [Jannaschia sp. LMIT008]
MEDQTTAPWIGPLLTILTLVIGSGLTLATTWVIERNRAKTAKERHHEDRIWDLRRSQYSEIVAHLKKAAAEAGRDADGYYNHEHGPEGYHGSKESRERARAAWAAWSTAKQTFDASRLIVSPEFDRAFLSIGTALEAVDEHGLPPNIVAMESKCFSDGYEEILRIARREIASP